MCPERLVLRARGDGRWPACRFCVLYRVSWTRPRWRGGLGSGRPSGGLADTKCSQARAVIGIQAVQEFLRDVEEHAQVRFGELPGDHFLEHAPIGLPG